MMLCVSGGKTKLDFLLYIFLLNSAAEYRSSFSHFVSLSIKKLFLYVFVELEVHLLEKKKKKDSCSVPLQCTHQMTKKSQESLWRKAVFGQLRCSLYLRSVFKMHASIWWEGKGGRFPKNGIITCIFIYFSEILLTLFNLYMQN